MGAVRALGRRSAGAGRGRRSAWPCNPDNKYIVHFPETREIWSFGSGYGGNALLGKKCFALRIASAMARDDGWLAEHMLILKLTNPEGEAKYIAAAFPSACGKTNLAMLVPTIPGWKAETIGDDICWMKFGDDGRLYAINPEAGFFGVAPGTGYDTNPNAMETLWGNCIFTNTALTGDGDVWWEGMSDDKPGSRHRLEGQRVDARVRDARRPPQRPIHRSRRRSARRSPRVGRPRRRADLGDPVRRSPRTTVPLVTQAFDWEHGVFLGSIMASETTAAAAVPSASCASTPWPCCRSAATTWPTTSPTGWRSARTPMPPTCRRSSSSTGSAATTTARFLWPGYGENSRVLKWVFERVAGTADAVETPIGLLPAAKADLDTTGLFTGNVVVRPMLPGRPPGN